MPIARSALRSLRNALPHLIPSAFVVVSAAALRVPLRAARPSEVAGAAAGGCARVRRRLVRRHLFRPLLEGQLLPLLLGQENRLAGGQGVRLPLLQQLLQRLGL